MIIAFTLTMPNVGSWNGKWTGAGRFYCDVRSFRGKANEARAEELLAKGSWYYSWDDGWGASIRAERIDGRKAASYRRKSAGFCGYNWMVDTIIKYGKPLAPHEIEPFLAKQPEAQAVA